MQLSRRGFIAGLLAAPVIIKSGILMPVKKHFELPIQPRLEMGNLVRMVGTGPILPPENVRTGDMFYNTSENKVYVASEGVWLEVVKQRIKSYEYKVLVS